MKKFLAILLSVLFIFGCFAACGGNSDDKDNTTKDSTEETSANSETSDSKDKSYTFKIGGIGPVTGGAAAYGNAVKNGAQIAVDEINAKTDGKIKFEFKFEDDENDIEKAVNAYNALKDWDMQILMGTVTTKPCVAVASETYKDRIFELTPSGSSPDIIEGKDNVFQACFSDPNQGTASAQYIKEKELAKKVSVIYRTDDPYSVGIYENFKAEAEKNGIEIVYTGTFTADTANDFSVQVSKSQEAGAELVFLPIYYEPAALILDKADKIGYNPIMFGVDGMDGILTLKSFNKALAEDVMLLTPFSADATDDLTVKFVTTYKEKFGETPNQFAADAYDSIYTIYAAIEKAGISDDLSNEEICTALSKAITEITVDGITGTGMTWKSTGEVSKAPKAVVIKDGVYVGYTK